MPAPGSRDPLAGPTPPTHRGGGSPAVRGVRVLAISPGDPASLSAWLAALARLPGAGALVREPALDAAALRDLAARAAAVAPLVVLHAKNPHAAAVAAELGLPVHGPVGSFGVSCHDEADVDAAFAAGAAYALLSPVWRPTSKHGDARTPLGPDRFIAIAAGRPVYALGGVTPERHARLVARGAHGSAVLGGLDAFVRR